MSRLGDMNGGGSYTPVGERQVSASDAAGLESLSAAAWVALAATVLAAVAIGLAIGALVVATGKSDDDHSHAPPPVGELCGGTGEQCCVTPPNERFLDSLDALTPLNGSTNQFEIKTLKPPRWSVGQEIGGSGATGSRKTQVMEKRITAGLEQRVPAVYGWQSSGDPSLPTFGDPSLVCPLYGHQFYPGFADALAEQLAGGIQQVVFYDNDHFHPLHRGFPIKVAAFVERNDPATNQTITCASLAAQSFLSFFEEQERATITLRVETIDTYYFGVWAGGMTNDGQVVIKSRIPTNIALNGGHRGWWLRMAQLNAEEGRWMEFAPELRIGSNPMEPDSDGNFEWIVTGLSAGCEYNMVVVEPDYPFDFYPAIDESYQDQVVFKTTKTDGLEMTRSDVGRFRMPPARGDQGLVRFGIAGDMSGGPVGDVLQGVENKDLDFFIHVGDWVYADFILEEPYASADPTLFYRELYEQGWRNDGFRNLLMSTGLLAAVPDDHEVTDGWENFGIASTNASFETLIMTNDEVDCHLSFIFGGDWNFAAHTGWYDEFNLGDDYLQDELPLAAFAERLKWVPEYPADRYPAPGPSRTNSMYWGDVHMITMDKNPLVDQDAQTVTYHEDQGYLFRPDEFAWLKQELLQSTGRVRFIAFSGKLPAQYVDRRENRELGRRIYTDRALEVLPGVCHNESFVNGVYDKTLVATSAYTRYTNQWDELFDWIADNSIRNVVILSGGEHQAFAQYVDSTKRILDLHAPSIGIWNTGHQEGTTDGRLQFEAGSNAHMPLLYQHTSAYNMITYDPKANTLTMDVIYKDITQTSITFQMD